MTHGLITGSELIKARVAVVYGTPCPKWHVDKVDLRGLCTLYGPGCCIMDEGELNLNQGDVVYMKGIGEAEREKFHRGVIHRSPIVEHDCRIPRLVVQTDSV